MQYFALFLIVALCFDLVSNAPAHRRKKLRPCSQVRAQAALQNDTFTASTDNSLNNSAFSANSSQATNGTDTNTISVSSTVIADPALNSTSQSNNTDAVNSTAASSSMRLSCSDVTSRSKQSSITCDPKQNGKSTPLTAGDLNQNLNTFCFFNGKSAAALLTCDNESDKARRFAVPGDTDFNGEGAGCEHSCQAVCRI